MTVLDAEVCIVGAGPHGLAVATHLVTASPGLRERLIVLDPAGRWMSRWHDQFARLGIDVLRSAMVHHPGVSPGGLGEHTRRRSLPSSGLPYGVPLAAVFEGYCHTLVEDHRLSDHVLPAATNSIDVGRGEVTVHTDGGTIRACRVVVATNPFVPVVPEPIASLVDRDDRIAHSGRIDLRTIPTLAGERVVVVGGGLTAAHLVCGAIARGATVTQILRRPQTVRDFDVEPGWLGPRELNRFGVERDPRRRLALVLAARAGGSVPPWMSIALDAHREAGALRRIVHGADGVQGANVALDGTIRIELAGTQVIADRLWLATGTRPTIDADRALCSVARSVAAEVVDGYPVLDPDLRVPGTSAHVVGRLAAPTIGPAAGNLWGARVAARRITRSITGIDLDCDAIVRIPAPAS